MRSYRALVPGRVRDVVGAMRARGPVWLQSDSGAATWMCQAYSPPQWEQEYRTGKWRYMHGLQELARYSVVIGYARFFRPGGAVLDLGCGEGILQQRLGTNGYSRYMGVDVSEVAIARARERTDASTMFVCADVERFEPGRKFDVIVFNEVLYYFSDPLAVLRRFESLLEPDGIFIVSMFSDSETSKNWSVLERAYEFIDETTTGNAKSGFAWSCRVARPGPRLMRRLFSTPTRERSGLPS
ncbi:MAG: class I SAM-dependent methyltransferase [Polyangiales bacterium]